MAAYFDGLAELPIKEIRIENVSFGFKNDAQPDLPAMALRVEKHCREGIYADNVEKLILKNVTFDNVSGEEIILKDVGELVKE